MSIQDAIQELEVSINTCRFSRLKRICDTFFGAPRIRGSHHIYRTPWSGDPRINIQSDGASAKPYQVRQVLAALQKLDDMGD